MSWTQCPDPIPGDAASVDAIETIIVPRARDVGGFEVRRALPAIERQMVGPFIFFDQMGPGVFEVGQGLDVRPHPHINLATITYLFDGQIHHRDSVGADMVIEPGAVNLMTAGRGIVHSERTPATARSRPGQMLGLQTWIALPQRHEETEPSFAHYAREALPTLVDGGATARLISGSAWGLNSPVSTHSNVLYADIVLASGGVLPIDATAEEQALYLVSGAVVIDGQPYEPGRLLVLRDGATVSVRNPGPGEARLALVGGDTLEGPRYIWWNFVSSRRERIEQAKEEWRSGRFDTVPGDTEFIPLPAG